jgi:hypothetical protein
VSSIRNLLCATLAVGVLLSAPRAEARFGKHSSKSSSSKSSKTHSASAVGSSDDDDDAPRSHASAASFLVDVLFALLIDTRPPVAYVVPAPPPPAVAEAEPPSEVQASASNPEPLSVRLGMDGAALTNAAGLGAFLGVEGERAGMDARAMALTLPTDDGTQGRDSITLMSLHLTYALITAEHARLRIEGGISGAHAPDLTALGPSLALSLEACLAGNLDLELRAQATPYPYRQLDGQAGLALNMNSFVLRGGWRALYLNDNGLVDDVEHADTLAGPYVGLGFSF